MTRAVQTLWRIGVDTPDYTADDVTGAGAKITGGRWNRKGNAVLYTSTSIALACLETVVHMKSGGLPLSVDQLAEVALAQGLLERAARLCGAVDGAREAFGIGFDPHYRASYARTLTETRASLGDNAFEAAWAEGRALTLEQAVVEGCREGG